MGLNKLEGIPWHIERFHRSENDDRRHKSRCVYYLNGMCKKNYCKCFSSAHCDYYIESKKETTGSKEKKNLNTGKYILKRMMPSGNFTVMYLSDRQTIYRIIGDNSEGRTITTDAPLTIEVLKHDVGFIFKVNAEYVKLIEKNITYK